MKRSRFSGEQIIGILKEHQAGLGEMTLSRKQSPPSGRLDRQPETSSSKCSVQARNGANCAELFNTISAKLPFRLPTDAAPHPCFDARL